MSTKVKPTPIPPGFHAVTPYMPVHQVRKTIDFLKAAFDAKEINIHTTPDGRIMNAIVQIRDSMVFFGEKSESEKPWPAMLYMYVEDVDKVFKGAVTAGGKVIMSPMDQVYGERSAGVEDPSGNQWWISTRLEDLSNEEINKRVALQKK